MISNGNIAKVTKGLVEKAGHRSPINGLATYEIYGHKNGDQHRTLRGIEPKGQILLLVFI